MEARRVVVMNRLDLLGEIVLLVLGLMAVAVMVAALPWLAMGGPS